MPTNDAMLTVLRRGPNAAGRSGIEVYSDSVEKVLASQDIEYGLTVLKDIGGLRNIFSIFFSMIKNMMRSQKDDIFHVTDELYGFCLPLIKGKRIITFHHVLKDNSSVYDKFWRFSVRIALRYADKIVVISSQTKKDLMERYGIPDDRITTVFSEIGSQYKDLGLTRKRIIGCVSTLVPRKNVGAAIRSFSSLTKMSGTDDMEMVICGKGREYDDLISLVDDLGLSEKVRFIQDLSDEELVEFYNTCSVIANPTTFEGFGYTTLEAQRCSAPVVIFKDAEIPEEVTRFAVKAIDEEDFAMKMHQLVSEEEFRKSIVSKGKEYADSFGTDFTEKMKEVYDLK